MSQFEELKDVRGTQEVYLLDAYDDVEEDLENNSYNPLFFRYELTAEESPVDFKARIRNACQRSLSIYMPMNCLA